jgi:5-methylcytosine-specific restriction protein A
VRMLKTSIAPILKGSQLKTLEAKAGATQRIRGTSWQNLRAEVFKRDGFKCVACERVLAMHHGEVDHVTPLEQGGTNALHNLQLLCVPCHAEKTAREAGSRAGRWNGWGGG